MTDSTIEEVTQETIESPYRISWVRVGRFLIPLLILVLIISFWFLNVYIPSSLDQPKESIFIPDTKVTTSSAKAVSTSATATESANKD